MAQGRLVEGGSKAAKGEISKLISIDANGRLQCYQRWPKKDKIVHGRGMQKKGTFNLVKRSPNAFGSELLKKFVSETRD